ncbi:D-lyxose/D-mannose family sugar isomerase [Oryzicola mucosus]|uniref:D-lyxose ketol-isomerase n=1 Tax=Oryzicola mucosus TaxID=2767425 RepID=A0A8J6U1W6_9HYPH|nr:D-lyxose/D-mannose family sugar isomerase [Oryzicola mucosus]MBD0417416.1 D-lyxose/D-mannose family sugar isomerase [Oryzicola mucosus]
MKQSEVNRLCREADECFRLQGWILPPNAQFAATDFGLGDYRAAGLVEVLLANEPEYCEKIMYASENMSTPAHTHGKKKEDIICRSGELRLTVWADNPRLTPSVGAVEVQINREMRRLLSGEAFFLKAGERITLTPGIWHEFAPSAAGTLIGEVSTWCDEATDNFFADPRVDIFHAIEPDETAEYGGFPSEASS